MGFRCQLWLQALYQLDDTELCTPTDQKNVLMADVCHVLSLAQEISLRSNECRGFAANMG